MIGRDGVDGFSWLHANGRGGDEQCRGEPLRQQVRRPPPRNAIFVAWHEPTRSSSISARVRPRSSNAATLSHQERPAPARESRAAFSCSRRGGYAVTLAEVEGSLDPWASRNSLSTPNNRLMSLTSERHAASRSPVYLEASLRNADIGAWGGRVASTEEMKWRTSSTRA
jgi:hypothetical protein